MTRSTELIHGDCIAILEKMEDNSVDSIVTDPPYGLSFMGKKWDYDVPSVEMWKEAFRVLKPGGYLLSFAGSRTYHRMAVNIEDAGFEIRDQIMWVYGSGFPKSQSVSKNIDKKAGRYVEGEVLPSSRTVKGPLGFQMKEKTAENPQTDEAKKWEGWGSSLKPAHEPIVVARKPLIGTIVENVLEHGTGGLNIDGCRIATNEKLSIGSNNRENAVVNFGMKDNKEAQDQHALGRFPANFIHDGSDEVVNLFPQSNGGAFPKKSNVAMGEHYEGGWGNVDNGVRTEMGNGSAARFFYCAKASKAEKDFGLEDKEPQLVAWSNQAKAELKRGSEDFKHENDEAKPSSLHNKVEYRKNIHPTVKPVNLMKYLCRLVTPPNGVVLDPFMGSGTTGIAANVEGFNFIGIEREEEYIGIARHRISHWVEIEEQKVRVLRAQRSLFEW